MAVDGGGGSIELIMKKKMTMTKVMNPATGRMIDARGRLARRLQREGLIARPVDGEVPELPRDVLERIFSCVLKADPVGAARMRLMDKRTKEAVPGLTLCEAREVTLLRLAEALDANAELDNWAIRVCSDVNIVLLRKLLVNRKEGVKYRVFIVDTTGKRHFEYHNFHARSLEDALVKAKANEVGKRLYEGVMGFDRSDLEVEVVRQVSAVVCDSEYRPVPIASDEMSATLAKLKVCEYRD